MKNIIVIVIEYFYPENRPDSHLLTEITKTLAKTNNANIKGISNMEFGQMK